MVALFASSTVSGMGHEAIFASSTISGMGYEAASLIVFAFSPLSTSEHFLRVPVRLFQLFFSIRKRPRSFFSTRALLLLLLLLQAWVSSVVCPVSNLKDGNFSKRFELEG